MNAALYIEWLFPVFIIPLSFCLNRWVPYKKIRYTVYVLILAAAFFLDLFKVSFRSELIDNVMFFSVQVIITEFFFNLLKTRKKIWAALVTISFTVFFFYTNSAWLMAGSSHNELRRNTTIEVYKNAHGDYALEKRLSRNFRHPSYVYVLNRNISRTPFEEQIDSYLTQDGYFKAKFLTKWEDTKDGVKLDLIVEKDTLWSLGESCKTGEEPGK